MYALDSFTIISVPFWLGYTTPMICKSEALHMIVLYNKLHL